MHQHSQTHADSPERGAGLAEYALLLALIALAVIGAVTSFGDQLAQSFVDITATLFS